MTLTFSVVTNLPLFGGSLTLNSELRLRACRIALSTHDAFNRSQRVSNFCVSEVRASIFHPSISLGCDYNLICCRVAGGI